MEDGENAKTLKNYSFVGGELSPRAKRHAETAWASHSYIVTSLSPTVQPSGICTVAIATPKNSNASTNEDAPDSNQNGYNTTVIA